MKNKAFSVHSLPCAAKNFQHVGFIVSEVKITILVKAEDLISVKEALLGFRSS